VRGTRRGACLTAAALSLLVGLPHGGATAGDAVPAAEAAAGPTRAEEATAEGLGRWWYRPRFVPAAALLEDAVRLGAGPGEIALEPLRGRLLVTARERDLAAVQETLAFLDAPAPQALVTIAVAETLALDRRETGGHALYDRSAGEGPDTLFRGVRVDFEPDEYLRSLLPGASPFAGADVHAADDASGVFDAVLRGLVHRGEAELHACPSLLLTEGIPGRLESTVELPETVFVATQVGADVTVTAVPIREKAGIVLEAVAERIGTDHVVLRLKTWLRQVTAGDAETGAAGTPVLAVREIDARVRVGDRESVVVGGLHAFERTRARRGVPGLARLPALDAVASARRRTSARTEIVFLAGCSIRTPGRVPGTLPPGELERLAGGG
jgi:type II secretory pathway component GspD/PulD (secretin)